MKTITASLVLLILWFACKAQIPLTPVVSPPPPPLSINNLNLNCGGPVGPSVYTNTSDIYAANTANDNLNCNSFVEFQSSTSITLNPGFTASSCGNGGSFTARIIPAITPVMIHPDPTTYPADVNATYQKFEFGLPIPSNVQSNINAYLNNPTYPQPAGSINPYDPQQIIVQAVFTAPNGNTYTRYGFYYEAVTENGDDNPTLPAWSITQSIYPFRVRFAPPQTGTWQVSFAITLLPKTNPTSLGLFTGTFNVATNSGNSGNIIVGNHWHFKFDNYQGTGGPGFFPVGQNIAWPDEPNTDVSHGGYWPAEAGPDEFNVQRGYIQNLANHSGNFINMYTVSEFGYELEFAQPDYPHPPNTQNYSDKGVYQFAYIPLNYNSVSNMFLSGQGTVMPNFYRQDQAYELDKTLSLCETDGIYIMLELVDASKFFLFNQYDGSNGDHFPLIWQMGNEPYYNFLYNKYHDNNPDNILVDFFTDPDALQYIKNRLFYIEARWGYSPNIFAWNIFNETDQIGLHQSSASDYGANYNNIVPDIATWAKNLITYLHGSEYTFYPQHIITNGYAGGPAGWGPGASPNGYDATPKYLDFLNSHSYYDYYNVNNPPGNNGGAAPSYFGYMYGENNLKNLDKPYLFGETGITNCYAIYGYSDKPFSFYAWSGAFCSSGVGLNWWDWQENEPPSPNALLHRPDFTGISKFFSNIDFEKNNFAIIPQYQRAPMPTYMPSGILAGDYYSLVDSNANYLGGNQYSNINFEIGWVHNTSENWTNDAYMYTPDNNVPLGDPHYLVYSNYTDCSNVLLSAGTTPITTASYVVFTGLKTYTNYTISYYDVNDNLLQTTSASTLIFGTIYDYTVQLNASHPDVEFILSDGTFQNGTETARQIASQKLPKDTTLVLPTDTVYLSKDSLHCPESSNNNTQGAYYWNFGNGQTSTKLNPAWKYNVPGKYLLTCIYSDTSKPITIHIRQEYVVLDTASVFKYETNNETNSNGIEIVPNPVSKEFCIYLKYNTPINEVTLSDAVGRICLREFNPKTNVVNTSSLPTGIYFVRILSASYQYNAKIIKE